MREKAYKAYFEMQKLKTYFTEQKNSARRNNDKETAEIFGDRNAVVGECMHILVKEFKLTFEG